MSPDIQAPDVQAKVISIIAAVKRIPADSIRTEATLVELGLDSLDKINVLFELESAFDVDIPDEDAQNISTVGEIVSKLQAVVHQAPQQGQ
jgi:acyl carrier protein